MSEPGARPTIVWFRRDLRVADNPALARAAECRSPVVALYIRDESLASAPGAASRWWLHRALQALAESLRMRGIALVLRRGASAAVLDQVIAESGASAVLWNRCYEPDAIARDRDIKTGLERRGIEAQSFNGLLLFEPWTIQTREGGAFRVFAAFARACRAAHAPPMAVAAPEKMRAHAPPLKTECLESWDLRPTKPDWAGGLRASWSPGEPGAAQRWNRFRSEALMEYATSRDRPDLHATSRLSPHLHFGEISPRLLWHGAMATGDGPGVQKFLDELLWREFAHHLLFHAPELVLRPLREAFERFPWRDDEAGFVAWTRGRTGYPIVDAGMRELWHCGWMHNRVRMIAASFLVKHLLIDWRRGAEWFRDTLVDADLANNSASWQWVAGCGADAAPYFRIFNPMLQGARFDPAGAYVRRFVPELARLPDDFIHAPWTAPSAVLKPAGIELGRDYPRPIIDHAAARKRALAAFATLRITPGSDPGVRPRG
jgi:deoxyribodipyrimidine photo-lyase